MAALDIVEVPIATGVADVAGQAVAAASGGDTAPIGPDLFLYVNNADAASKTVTIVTEQTVDGLAIADASLVVAAGDHGIIPLTLVYRGTLGGRASITYSAVTSVTVAVFRLAQD